MGPGVTPYFLFFIAGLAFGYAAPGVSRWVPLLFPLILALGAALGEGIDGTLIWRLVVALVVTVAGILLGALLDRRAAGGYARPA
jgi:hypothetical protein